jgi:uncharacterized protein YjiS (DUF1127 family)
MTTRANEAPGAAEAAGFFTAAGQRILRWRNARRTRRVLLGLDDRMLNDIGLSHADVLSGRFTARSHGNRSHPAVKTTLLTIIVVVGSLAAAIVSGSRPPMDAGALASCALFSKCTQTVSIGWR